MYRKRISLWQLIKNNARRLPNARAIAFSLTNAFKVRRLLANGSHGDKFRLTLVFGVPAWKQELLVKFLSEQGAGPVYFCKRTVREVWLSKLADAGRISTLVVWGMPERDPFQVISGRYDLPLWRLEDAFIRSTGLGAAHILPKNLILDKTGGIYFDATRESALETFIEMHEFTDDERKAGLALIAEIKARNISKYNLKSEMDEEVTLSSGANILVMGQYELDASIRLGAIDIKLNTELIELAISENPSAKIYYRPHPDITAGLRPAISDVYRFNHRVTILDQPMDIWTMFPAFEKIYVNTSLSGLEACLRGAKVRVAGLPFYAGWGITDDRHHSPRRTAKRSIEEIVYAAYIHAPTACPDL